MCSVVILKFPFPNDVSFDTDEISIPFSYNSSMFLWDDNIISEVSPTHAT